MAVIVANAITGDSRVQKTAIAAARDGWDVTLIGLSRKRGVQRSTFGAVDVLRVPVKDAYRHHLHMRDGLTLRRRLTQFGLPNPQARHAYRAAHRAWLLDQDSRLATTGGAGALLKPLRRQWTGGRDAVHRFRDRLWGWEEHHRPKDRPPTGEWRLDWPAQVDFDLAYVPVLVDLAPDVIHANDITMISTGALAVSRLRLSGHQVSWLYDAHEYVTGVDWPRPEMQSAFPAMEREFIHRPDAVVTVSPEIADILQKDYRLPETPLVVRNVPIRSAVGADPESPSVRAAAGVADGVPLLVYSGWLAAERGVRTAVDALVDLPECHLAIVSGHASAELTAIMSAASELGVWDRVHVVPYVPQHQVPDYLASADLGLICSRHSMNYELSLPTKLSEYLHGGVPVIASDVRTLRAFVEQHGVGEVFESDNPASFAEAVRRGLAHRAELTARISDGVLTELSWEKQSAGLLELYRRIAPRVPGTTRPEVSWMATEVQDSAADDDGELAAALSRRSWRPLADTPIRLGLGPANYAGQAAAFARAVTESNPGLSAEVFMHEQKNRYGFPADVYLDPKKLNLAEVQVAQLHRVRRYTHLLADGFRPVLAHFNGRHVGDDLPLLHDLGVKVALLAHGTEVRDPARHKETYRFSSYHLAPPDLVEALIGTTALNRRLAQDSGLPMFVTTPDLLDDLPEARWAPQVVDIEAWRCDTALMERRRPVVLHAPTARWTKGTELIVPVLEELDRQGRIELKLAEGLGWAQMRSAVQHADVVVDQVTTGAYGTLSCEAMAAGRVVIAHISDSVRSATGPDLPIVDATPETLAAVIGDLLDDRDRAIKTGMAGRAFTEKYHGGAWTARVLQDFLDS